MKEKKPWFSHSQKNSVKCSEIRNQTAEMQTWLRNLEQRLMSLNGRLDAVENRLTTLSIYQSKGKIVSIDEKTNKYHSMITGNKQTNNHFFELTKDIETINQQLHKLKQNINTINDFKNETQNDLKTIANRKSIHSPIVKIGKREIPLEITGVIGGMIAFCIAGLLLIDKTEIVFSPWFLSLIGFILTGSVFLRTKKGLTLMKKFFSLLFPHSNKTSVQSDSSS